jgi:hypothetical protein
MLRIFGPKRKLTESWKKLHNEEIHDLYPSLNFIIWAGHVEFM